MHDSRYQLMRVLTELTGLHVAHPAMANNSSVQVAHIHSNKNLFKSLTYLFQSSAFIDQELLTSAQVTELLRYF